jgi:nucleotide-binding universal stress UspA family protein
MKLLVATDGSKNALKAVRQAARLAAAFTDRTTITLISVHDDTALRHAERFVGKKTVDDYLRELSDHDLADSRKALDKAGVKHDMVIRVGHIAQEIASFADQGKFDMIVMGSKGRSALKDLLVGSVAQRVAELAKTPLLLVK